MQGTTTSIMTRYDSSNTAKASYCFCVAWKILSRGTFYISGSGQPGVLDAVALACFRWGSYFLQKKNVILYASVPQHLRVERLRSCDSLASVPVLRTRALVFALPTADGCRPSTLLSAAKKIAVYFPSSFSPKRGCTCRKVRLPPFTYSTMKIIPV